MAAVMGGTQSLHTNSFDEALGLPTEDSATLALRTQQILAHESGLTATVDPWAGSWFMEQLTDDLEDAATDLFDQVEALGGAVAAIEAGWMQSHIEDSAYREARSQESGDSVVVGLNRFLSEETERVPVMRVDPKLEPSQVARLVEWRAARGSVGDELRKVDEVARTAENLLPSLKAALAAGATIGEVSDVLRGVFGTHR
jgi:methylmalonyl-CoA mutase, N-terminal domain